MTQIAHLELPKRYNDHIDQFNLIHLHKVEKRLRGYRNFSFGFHYSTHMWLKINETHYM